MDQSSKAQPKSKTLLILVILALILGGILVWVYFSNKTAKVVPAPTPSVTESTSDLSAVDKDLSSLDQNFNSLDKIDATEDNAPSL